MMQMEIECLIPRHEENPQFSRYNEMVGSKASFLSNFCRARIACGLAFVICVLPGFAGASNLNSYPPALATEICASSESQKIAILNCLREQESEECEGFSKEQRRNCFDPDDQIEVNYSKACAVGTVEGVKATIKGVTEIALNAVTWAQDRRGYNHGVVEKAHSSCREDSTVRKAFDIAERTRQNTIAFEFARSAYSAANDAYTKCFAREKSRGDAFGVSFELPDLTAVTGVVRCLNSRSQAEMVCSVVVPMAATGAAAAVIKQAVKTAAGRAMSFTKGDRHKKIIDDYLGDLEQNQKLTMAEKLSLSHQKDLLAFIGNPRTQELIKKLDIDERALMYGILDSDLGKLDRFKKLLVEKSPQSDRLLAVLSRKDTTSPAGKAFAEFLDENGFPGRGFFNPALSPDEIRSGFQAHGILTGYLHEAPGISNAIEALNQGRISKADFKKRIGANLGHNGPQAGFWDFLSGITSKQIASSDIGSKFFKDTIFEGDTVAGKTQVKYISPMTNEGLVHTLVDRLSQATSGGDVKIFYELAGKSLNDNHAVPIGAIPTASGSQSGLGILKNLLSGDKATGVVPNAIQTLEQFKALREIALRKPDLSAQQKSSYSDLVKLAEGRTKALQDHMDAGTVSYVSGKDGKLEKIILTGPKETGSKFVGTISADTPTLRAMEMVKTYLAKEELLHGDPIRDLGAPRMASASEARARTAGAVVAGAAVPLMFYCQGRPAAGRPANNSDQAPVGR